MSKKPKELYLKYRPKQLSEIVGQDASVDKLQAMIDDNSIPHALLFTGPSGCGKTTLARIIRRKLKCHKHDFREINGSNKNGVDDVRELEGQIHAAPMMGKCRIWLIDEVHQMSKNGQSAFLKMLEDTPNHVYFMLATTDPGKLSKAIQTRCTEIKVNPLSDDEINNLLQTVLSHEKKSVTAKVAAKIIEYSEGSARKALVYLHEIINIKSESKMLAAIVPPTAEVQAIKIARALMNKNTTWTKMAEILRETATEDPESIRWMVLGYAKTVLLSGKGPLVGRGYILIDAFRDHFYDSKHAGLAAACYEVNSNKD